MSWQAIARKDFQDAVRSYWLWGLSAVFILLVAGTAGVLAYLLEGSNLTSSSLLGALNGFLITSLVPLIALVMAYGAIVGERDSGSIKLLLSLPHTRQDVVLGKVLGRSGAIVVPVLIGFVLPGIAFAATVQFQAVKYFGFMLMTALLAVVFVSIAVGFSASIASQRLVVLGTLAFYFVFVTLWGSIQLPLQFMIGLGGYPESLQWIPIEPQQLIDLLRVINPTGAFKIISNNFLGDTLFAPNAEGVDPNYHFAAMLTLVAWILAPLAIGMYRFEQADL